MRNRASVEYKRGDPKSGLVKLVNTQTDQAGNHRRSRIRILPRGTIFSRIHKVVSEVGWKGKGRKEKERE